MSSSRSEGSERRGRGRSRASLLIPIAGAVIGFAAALLLLRELDIFESDPLAAEPTLSERCDYPLGYFSDICNLVAQATLQIAAAVDAETALACVEDGGDVCRSHREGLRQALPESERLRDRLFELDPPEHAADWHGRYLTAIAALHSGYYAQFRALVESDREAFLAGHERTVAAAGEAGALWDDFRIAFTDERAP